MQGPRIEPGGADLRRGSAHQTEEQLALDDRDERLPWLESDEEYEDDGFDGRTLAFALIGLLVAAAILAGGWLLLRDAPDGEMVADGGTIEAPDAPYKTRPENAGGAEVVGTGDVSFEVAEGLTREGRLADNAPAPNMDLGQVESEGQGEGEGRNATARTGVGVQIGAFSTRQAAQTAWQQFSGRFEGLQGMNYRILEGSADSGTIYRLQAVAANGEAADALCRSIRASGGDCQVKR